MDLDLGFLSEVVARHTPTLFIHPADRYLPCTAEYFLQHSELRQELNGGQHRTLLARGQVTPEALAAQQAQHAGGGRLWLDLDACAHGGMPPEQLNEVPLYVQPKAVVDCRGNLEALELSYITIYAYNGDYRLGGLPLIRVGSHVGDVEHATARVHPLTGALLGFWYNSHRSRDGCWVAGHQVQRDPATGAIAAYVAKHGHGVYPKPGRVLRHFCLANDLCSASGPAWRPQRVVLLPHEEQAAAPGAWRVPRVDSRGSALPDAADNGGGHSSPPEVVTDDPCKWLSFRGRWGTTDAPMVQGWMRKAEPPLSRKAFERVFCHFLPEPKQVRGAINSTAAADPHPSTA